MIDVNCVIFCNLYGNIKSIKLAKVNKFDQSVCSKRINCSKRILYMQNLAWVSVLGTTLTTWYPGFWAVDVSIMTQLLSWYCLWSVSSLFGLTTDINVQTLMSCPTAMSCNEPTPYGQHHPFSGLFTFRF